MICGISAHGGPPHPALDTLYPAGNEELRAFDQAFQKSALYSIYAFLARNPQYEEVGKACISACLLSQEHPQRLFSANTQPNETGWYGYLWNRIIDGITNPADMSLNKVTFITFNFDRSLEFFLHVAIMNTFNLNDVDARNVWTKFQFHHVYGSLGLFEGFDRDRYGFPFSFDDNTLPGVRRQMITARDSIRVVPAQRAQVEDERAKQILSSAEQIIFLGFAFDAVNCARLGIKSLVNSEKLVSLYMTSMGLTASEVAVAKRHLTDRGPTIVQDFQGDCLSSLRHWGALHDPAV